MPSESDFPEGASGSGAGPSESQALDRSVPNQGFSLSRVLVCGTNLGVGVSTICFGLAVSYTRMQVSIGTATLGSSLIEPTHYRRIANRLCYTIDPSMLTSEAALAGLRRLSDGTELAILEGCGGLFDVRGPGSSYATNADFAAQTRTPVVLVVNADGYGESITALISGFKNYRKDIIFAGVILNRVSSKAHAERLREAIEQGCDTRVVGAVRPGDPHQMGATLASYRAHNPSALTRNRVIGTGNLIREGVDLELLRRIGDSAETVPEIVPVPQFHSRRARIAVADDQAFHLTIQDNLDLLRRAGAELVPFSPIADQNLPKNIQAVYFPGGYPHLYAQDLQANQPIRKSIKQYMESGGRLYAEAGALAYLAKRLTTFQGISYDMVGAFPAQATATLADDIQPELPIEMLESTADNLLGKGKFEIRGLREPRWSYRLEGNIPTCFERQAEAASRDGSQAEAFSPFPEVVLSRGYLHWGSYPDAALSLLSRALPQSSK